MGCFKFQHVGIFLLVVSLGLLVLPIVTVPLTRIELFVAKLQGGSQISVGMLGLCIRESFSANFCTSAKLGYGGLSNTLQVDFGSQAADTSFNRLTYGLVMHVIAAAMALLALLIALCSDRFGFLFASMFAGLAWIGAVIALAIDLTLYLLLKRKVEQEGGTLRLGVGLWATDVAALTLFFATLVILVSVCAARRSKTREQKQTPVYQPLMTPMGTPLGAPPFAPYHPFVPGYQYDKVHA
ncbi:hypothetical protein OIV83_004188 [Microbotryomycetes sp. JL201]|nr:hypothetical protein OIV83_004188 [Microbotryomycetes sp. JL201]